MDGQFTIELTPQMLSIIPILALVLQMIKGIAPLAKLKPWLPLLAVGLGIAMAVLMKMGTALDQQVVSGIVLGLATSGGYDAARTPTKALPGAGQ